MSISVEQLKQLSIKSLDNCNSLFFEAKLLHENGHYARAIFLAKTAQEELGKHIMCASGINKLKEGEFDVKKFIRRFRNHNEKSLNATAWEEIILGRFQKIKDGEFFEYNKNLQRKTALLEEIRQRSLYVGFEQGQILLPSEFDEEASSAYLDHLTAVLKYLDDGVFLEAIESFS